jgi:putative transposase
MKARYQSRFYPTDQQRQSLAQLFGCVRVVWNDALAICKQSVTEGHVKLPGFNKLSAMLTHNKRTDERQWLKAVSSVPLQQSLRHLDVAYQNFFNSRNGKRKGQKVGSPKFKRKSGNQSAEFTRAAFSRNGESIYLAKIGDINPIWSRELPSEPSSITVIKDCANRYFLSFVVEIEPIAVAPIHPSVGIDLGLKTFAVLSTGELVQSPDYSKQDRKIRKLQRKLARQERGSNRRNNIRLRIAKLHNKIADTRKDFLHKLSTKVVSENQAITLEDLNVSDMVKNRKLARSISLQGWREFRQLCEAKSEKFGRQFQTISRWEPTSQICSECGYRWGKLDLKVRTVICLNCGVTHNRDENAAKNINKVGIGPCHDSKRTQRDSKTTSVASFDEASRITVAT